MLAEGSPHTRGEVAKGAHKGRPCEWFAAHAGLWLQRKKMRRMPAQGRREGLMGVASFGTSCVLCFSGRARPGLPRTRGDRLESQAASQAVGVVPPYTGDRSLGGSCSVFELGAG